MKSLTVIAIALWLSSCASGTFAEFYLKNYEEITYAHVSNDITAHGRPISKTKMYEFRALEENLIAKYAVFGVQNTARDPFGTITFTFLLDENLCWMQWVGYEDVASGGVIPKFYASPATGFGMAQYHQFSEAPCFEVVQGN